MSFRRAAASSLVLLLVFPALAGAQGFKWWNSDTFRADLGLTTDQVTRLDEVYQGLLPKLASGKDALDRLEKQLSDVVAAGMVPEGEVMNLVDQTEHARSELAKTRMLMVYRMHQILTVEQRAKMNALHAKWEQDRRQGRRPPGR
jgi:Spy/CpxP family protein refolding chaperone